MVNLNKVFLAGNLTRDPEVRNISSGAAVANLGLAVNRYYSTKNGERKEETLFIRVVVWGKVAESCKEYLTKGSPVLVEGRLMNRSWEQNGQKRNTIEVVALSVQFLSRGTKGGSEKMSTGYDEQHDESVPLDESAVAEGPSREDDDIPF
ncbi:MAG: single-stranded DNA-binding protein [Candidatus Ancaeobacter aquaticus]|nr:single-stranded DNA-binding protein [Candidatus Ancaeobacter aquaticus]